MSDRRGPDGTGPWDNPGITPDGRRNRHATDGPRIRSADESDMPPVGLDAGEGRPNPGPNVQAGLPLGDQLAGEPDLVATGDRRDEVHYEDDPDQVVRVAHLQAAGRPLPPDEQRGEDRNDCPGAMQDAQEMPSSPSVWDARPPED